MRLGRRFLIDCLSICSEDWPISRVHQGNPSKAAAGGRWFVRQRPPTCTSLNTHIHTHLGDGASCWAASRVAHQAHTHTQQPPHEAAATAAGAGGRSSRRGPRQPAPRVCTMQPAGRAAARRLLLPAASPAFMRASGGGSSGSVRRAPLPPVQGKRLGLGPGGMWRAFHGGLAARLAEIVMNVPGCVWGVGGSSMRLLHIRWIESTV